MAWPYRFITLSDNEKHARRLALDRYALYAQLSALLPVLLFLGFRVALYLRKRLAARNGDYDAVPPSPSLKVRRRSTSGTLAGRLRMAIWWLGDDVSLLGQSWGQRDQWLLGTIWTVWLLVLSIAGTGDDYLHLTKRFGIIAVSQFPVQYLLALKSTNPLVVVFGSSHEQLNRWHRVLGRITYLLLCLHASFYVNFFAQKGVIGRRLFAPVVFMGVLAFIAMSFMNATALGVVRKYSYRVFFIVHLAVAFSLPPLLFFHAQPARLYVIEAIVLFIVDLASRHLDTVVSQAAVEAIPGTDLIKVTAPMPLDKANLLRTYSGVHIFVSIPPASRPGTNPLSFSSYLLYELMFNPFSVAAVDEKSGDMTLVARRLRGPITNTMASFAAPSSGPDRGPVQMALNVEGPYGAAKRFPNLAGPEFDRVLLVAGGVGATFTIPIFRSILNDKPTARVQMVWAVRDAGEATWAVAGSTGRSLLDDQNVHIFLTGDIIDPVGMPGGEGSEDVRGLEMETIHRDRHTTQHNHKRPDLRKVVDDTFRMGLEERVAVLVCGPKEMAADLRRHVGAHVRKGRSVWWHNEHFGW